jgi:hypothetical protein
MEETILAVSLREAGRRIGVCERTVVNLIRSKEPRSRKIGRRRILRVKDLGDFLRRDHPIPKTVSNGQLNAYEVAGSSPPKPQNDSSESGGDS